MKINQLPIKRTQLNNCRQIAQILNSENFISSIDVRSNGRLAAILVSWDEYWKPVRSCMSGDLEIHWNELRAAQATYINRNYDYRSAVTYCWAYWTFLRFALDQCVRKAVNFNLLWSILGFECFGIYSHGHSEALAAATSSSRNPVYLLAKLRKPESREDPKCVPLITTFNSLSSIHSLPRLYYHYRQFKVSKEIPSSLFVYPSTYVEERIDSFRCIQTMTSGLSTSTDPRCRERAREIVDNALLPFFRKHFQDTTSNTSDDICIADLGSGSGNLTRNIFETLFSDYSNLMGDRKLSWTLVDVKFRNPRRHVANRKFFRRISSFRCVQEDYLSWIDHQPIRPTEPLYKVILICRLLNNTSHFRIGYIDDWHQVRKLSAKMLTFGGWRCGNYLPHLCLEGNDANPLNLFSSNKQIQLLNGNSFWQLSLSDYYRGLHLLTGKDNANCDSSNAIFFPIRRFNDSSLRLPSGGSAIERLCSLAEVCIIEDIDLNTQTLSRHLADYKLTDIAASDATKRFRMRSASLLCICRKEYSHLLPGRRIW